MRDPTVDRVFKAAGGVQKLAKALQISAPALYQWDRVPTERVLALEALTGIPRHELRPDIYPPDASPFRPTDAAGEHPDTPPEGADPKNDSASVADAAD